MGAEHGAGRGGRATVGAGTDDTGAEVCATAAAGADVAPGHRAGPGHGLGARVTSGPRAEPVPGLGARAVSGDAAKANSVTAAGPGLGGGPKAIRDAAAGLGADSGATAVGTGGGQTDSGARGRRAGTAGEIDTTVWRLRGTPLVGAAAPGPLTGLTVAVKDLYAVAGFPVGAGIPAYAREQAAAAEHAVAVARLLAAGAEVTGIAQTDEFAYSLTGSNGRYGMPVNPAAPQHIPGGSTSGPAVAVARGEVDIGLGTDTAGSIRVPAAYQGLWGIRTTHGRLDTTGLLPLAQSFDTIGWLTANGETLAVVAEYLLGADTAVPEAGAAAGPAGCADSGGVVGAADTADTRGSVGAADTRGPVGAADTGGSVGTADTGGSVGTADTGGSVGTADTGGPVGAADTGDPPRFVVDYALCDSADPVIAAAVRSVAGALRAEPVDLRPPGSWLAAFRTVQAYEAWANHGEWVAAHPGELEPDVAQRFAFAGSVTTGQADAARAELAAAADRIRTTLGNRVLVLPAAATPPPLRTADAEIRESTRARTLRLTCLASIAGLPAVTLPLGRDEGGPSGLCLVGAPGTDRSLIRLALSTAAVAAEGSPHSEDRV